MVSEPDQPGLPCSNANEGWAAHKFDPADGVKDEDILKSCTVCDSDAKMRCSTCGTWYCNEECLVKDWPHHKALCKTLKNEFNANKAPNKHNVRAILFPAGSVKPTWAWINLKALDISIVRALGITERKPLRKVRNALAVEDINKSLLHRKIGHGIRQFTTPKARPEMINSINLSIVALGDIGSLKPYFGSAIFISFRTYEDEGITKVCYEDATPRDLRMIVEWYHTRPDNLCISKIHRLPIKSYVAPGEEVALWPAVQILCEGDIGRFRMLANEQFEIFQNVKVLSKDILGVRSMSEFPRLAGLPWLFQPCHSIVDPVRDFRKESFLRSWAGRIYAQSKSESFQLRNLGSSEGWVLQKHLAATHSGTMIVLHKDGCKIDKFHVDCFIKYVEEALKQAIPIFTRDEGPLDSVRVITPGTELEKFITKEGFEVYWEDWIKKKAGGLAPIFCSPYNNIYAGETDPAPMTEEEVKKAREEVAKLLLGGA